MGMEDKSKKKLPLHSIQEDKVWSAINRTHTLIHSLSLSLLFYHRLSLFTLNDAVPSTPPPPPFLPCLLLFLAELLLSVVWLSEQPYRWRIVDRTAFIDRLPEETDLPAVDVVIVTADPDKEPTVEVMNTVVSAMGLDYPAGKLHVYLSDDGGAEVTLRAAKEAWGFATWWLPFCRKYGVECRCPMAYFEDQHNGLENCGDFFIDRLQLKEKYETFKRRVEANLSQIRETDKENDITKTNHPPYIQRGEEPTAHVHSQRDWRRHATPATGSHRQPPSNNHFLLSFSLLPISAVSRPFVSSESPRRSSCASPPHLPPATPPLLRLG